MIWVQLEGLIAGRGPIFERRVGQRFLILSTILGENTGSFLTIRVVKLRFLERNRTTVFICNFLRFWIL